MTSICARLLRLFDIIIYCLLIRYLRLCDLGRRKDTDLLLELLATLSRRQNCRPSSVAASSSSSPWCCSWAVESEGVMDAAEPNLCWSCSISSVEWCGENWRSLSCELKCGYNRTQHKRRRRGAGGGRGRASARPPNSGKIFSSNYYVKFGHFSGKNHVKFGNFVIFFRQI